MRRRTLRILIVALLLAGAIGLVNNLWLTWGVRITLAVLLLWVAIVYRRRYFIEPLKSRHVARELVPVPTSNAAILQRRASADKMIRGPGQAEMFALGIVLPSEIRQRIDEQHEPGHRTLRQRVTIEARVPQDLLMYFTPGGDGEQGHGVPFPIITPAKGDLHDNFVVYSSDGRRIQTLTYREYLRFIAGVLRILLMHAYKLQDGTDKLPIEAQQVELRALLALLHRGRTEPLPTVAGLAEREGNDKAERESARHQLDRLVRLGPARLLKMFASAQREEYRLTKLALDTFAPHELLGKLDAVDKGPLLMAAELVRKMSDNYAIIAFVPCDEDGRFMITYESTIVPGLNFGPVKNGHAYGRFKGWLRVFLGARPVSIGLSLGNAATCQSYHLRVLGPDGWYLHRQMLVDADPCLSRKAENAPTEPYIRFRPRRGQSYAHFYCRFFTPSHPEEPTPILRFVFLEAPPGSTFRAAVAAAANIILIWLVGAFVSHGITPGDEASAFLLVFPALAATWLGFEGPSRRLLDGTLAARLSLLTTAVTSIFASGLYMRVAGSGTLSSTYGGSWPLRITVAGITNMPWSLIALTAFLNALFIIYLYVVRSSSYHYLCSRPGDDNATEYSEEHIDQSGSMS